MPFVELNDKLFRIAERRAINGGFSSIGDYIADVLMHGDGDGDIDVDALFTPERIAKIDAALAQARAGHVLTADQAAAELARVREQWLKDNGR